MHIIDVGKFSVDAINMKSKRVKIQIFDHKRKALPDVATSTLDFLIFVQQVLDLLLIVFVVPKIIVFQELFDRARVVFSNNGLFSARNSFGVVIEDDEDVFCKPLGFILSKGVHYRNPHRNRGLVVEWEGHHVALVAVASL